MVLDYCQVYSAVLHHFYKTERFSLLKIGMDFGVWSIILPAGLADGAGMLAEAANRNGPVCAGNPIEHGVSLGLNQAEAAPSA